jgi:lysozyme
MKYFEQDLKDALIRLNPEITANPALADEVILIDVEVTDNVEKKTLQTRLKKYLQILENYYKVKPIIYTMPNFHNGHLKSEFNSYPFWIAHYNVEKPRFKEKSWKIWQYTDRGKLMELITTLI